LESFLGDEWWYSEAIVCWKPLLLGEVAAARLTERVFFFGEICPLTRLATGALP